jgi:hypothetical protein
VPVRKAVRLRKEWRTRRSYCWPAMTLADQAQEQLAAFPLVRDRFVGLGGLEPPASSLSEIDGQAPCYFSLCAGRAAPQVLQGWGEPLSPAALDRAEM